MTNYTGKFQTYYDKIKTETDKIMQERGYPNSSKAFAFWYFTAIEKLNDNDAEEAIIDGSDDNGIDAIVIRGECAKLYQFKFPEKRNINKSIDETTALKLINGYKKLTSTQQPRRANAAFLSFRERLQEEHVFTWQFYFVSFSDNLTESAEDALKTEIVAVKEQSGNEIEFFEIGKQKLCDRWDKRYLNHSITLEMRYISLSPGYNIDDEVNSWSGFAKAEDIINVTSNHMDIIFDENIRNYEGNNTPVNQGIIQTAANPEESPFFYFYNNGIVFICDKCSISPGSQTARLESAIVANGCQTLVSLTNSRSNSTLGPNIFLPIRIIETQEIELRAKITECLNSQNKIKDSYFLSNNSFIRDLQAGLLEKGYFLERLANEYSYKIDIGCIKEYPKENVLELEKTIQIYAAYYYNELAAIAKRTKNELFNNSNIEKLLTAISPERVINAYQIYSKVMKLVALYRKCRRSSVDASFLNLIGVHPVDDDQYEEAMLEYAFVNTGDFLLLNAVANIDKDLDADTKIQLAIDTCKSVLQKYKKQSISSATKSAEIFDEVQKNIMM